MCPLKPYFDLAPESMLVPVAWDLQPKGARLKTERPLISLEVGGPLATAGPNVTNSDDHAFRAEIARLLLTLFTYSSVKARSSRPRQQNVSQRSLRHIGAATHAGGGHKKRPGLSSAVRARTLLLRRFLCPPPGTLL